MRGKAFLLISGCILVVLAFLIYAHLVAKQPGGREKGEALTDLDTSGKLGKDSEATAPQKRYRPRPPIHRLPREPQPEEPLWGVTIGPLSPGMYEYYFIRDGETITDPLNPEIHAHQDSGPRKVSVFEFPLAAGATREFPDPEQVVRNPVPGGSEASAGFIYRGEISRLLLFVAGFRGGVWGTDEFEPLNEAARRNLDRIRKDRNLCRLTGVVKDPGNRPLAGALVRVQQWDEGYRNVRTIRADTRGVFTADRLPAGKVIIDARARLHYVEHPVARSLLPEATENSVEIVMKPGGGARGTVSDASGEPVIGAKITARWHEEVNEFLGWGFGTMTYWPATWTGPRGRYEFPGLPPGEHTFIVEACGFATAQRSPVEIRTGEFSDGVDFILGPGVDLPGLVVSGTGEAALPVPGATVYFWTYFSVQAGGSSRFYQHSMTSSDESGAFTMENLAPGQTYYLRAFSGFRKSRDSARKIDGAGERPEPVVLVLPPEGVIRGRVVDPAKRPVPGAAIRLTALMDKDGNLRPLDRRQLQDSPDIRPTDGEGRFRAGDLDPELGYELLVSAEGFAPAKAGPFPADSTDEHEVVLSGGGSITGRVVSGDDGLPLSGAKVWTYSDISPRELLETVTDMGGGFEFPNLRPGIYAVGGIYDVFFEPLTILPKSGINVVEGREATVDLEACSPVRITGTVTDFGRNPIPSAEVTFECETQQYGFHINSYFVDLPADLEESAVTDGEGKYIVRGLLPGRLKGNAAKDGYRSEYDPLGDDPYDDIFWGDPGKIVAAGPGETVEGVDFVLYGKPSPRDGDRPIRGTVYYPDGSPAPGIEVAAYYVAGMDHHCSSFKKGNQTITDAAGRFEIVDRRENLRGLAVLPTKENPYCGWDGISDSTDREARIDLGPCGRVIGIVGDESGKPVAEASVHLQWDSGCAKYNGDIPMSATTRDDGMFEFDPLPPGGYRISANKRGYVRVQELPRSLSLAGEQTIDDIVLVLRKQDAFRGRLVDQHGNPLEGWMVNSRTTGPDGAFEYSFHTGPMSLTMRKSSHILRGSATSVRGSAEFKTGTLNYPDEKPGDDTEFVLRLGGGAVTGRVVRKGSGEPEPGIDIRLEIDRDRRETPGPFPDCVLSSYSYRGERATRTDGSFEIPEVPPGAYVLTLSGASIQEKQVPSIMVGEGGKDLGTIEVEPARFIVGRLVDRLTREPVSGVEYRAEVRGRSGSGSFLSLSLGQPDHEGRFKISQVPDDLASIVFAAKRQGETPWYKGFRGIPGPAIFSTVLEPDLSEPGEVDVGDVGLMLYRVRLRVVDVGTGGPVSDSELRNMRVAARGSANWEDRSFPLHEMRAEADGTMTAPGTPPDTRSLEVKVPGFLPVTRDPLPPPDSTGIIDAGVFRLERGCTLRGFLTGPNGETVNGADLRIRDSKGNSEDCEANANGEFAVSGFFAGPATLTAHAYHRGGSNPWIGEEGAKASITGHEFTIMPNGETTVNVRFPPHGSE